MEGLRKLVSEKPVVIFSKSSCCMCYTVKSLLSDFGANPTVYELDKIPKGHAIEKALLKIGCSPTAPTVFIGGTLVGGATEVMAAHITSTLVPMLKTAGAIWL